MPVTARDLAVRSTMNNGKLFYSWSAEQGGRGDVVVTPRARRKPLEEGVSAHARKLARETTPEPALER